MYSSNQNDFQAQPSTATGIPTVPPPNYSYDANNTLSSHFQTTITQGSWSSGLCDCFSDLRNCCITCWCPCITFGQVAEIADKGASSCAANGAIYTLIGLVTACPCFYSCIYRSKMRQQYMLKGSPCGDFLIHCFCEACALCQEYRELKNRGYDMSIGWHGNVERQNRGTSVTPVAPEGGMSR